MRLNLYPEELRSKAHAERWAETPIAICPHIRRLWAEGYTPQQIAGITRMPLIDVRLMTDRMPRQGAGSLRVRLATEAGVIRLCKWYRRREHWQSKTIHHETRRVCKRCGFEHKLATDKVRHAEDALRGR